MEDTRKWETISSQIKGAASLDELRESHASLFSFLQCAQIKSIDTYQTYSLLSHMHDLMMKKALKFAEQTVHEEGCGSPPSSYCWIIMGSGGRREQTIGTDQDNGIVYQCSPHQDPQHVQTFVQRFATLGVEYLQKISYPFCPGNVMATNTRWCKSETEWKMMLGNWGNDLSVDSVRFLLIASDFRILYGNEALEEKLRDHFSCLVQNNHLLLPRLAEHAIVPPIPMGIFGQIFSEHWGMHAGKFNLKHGIYVQLVNNIRLWSLANGIQETSTLKKIVRLQEKKVWTASESGTVQSAFSHILYLRLQHHLRQNLQDHLQDHLLDHYLDLKQLNKQDFSQLKQAMKVAKRLQHKTKQHFIPNYTESLKRMF